MPIWRTATFISLITIISSQIVLKDENVTLPAPFAAFTNFNDSKYQLALQFLHQNHPELLKQTPTSVECQIVAGTYFRFAYANLTNSVIATVYVSLSNLVFFTSYRVAGQFYPLRDLSSYHWQVGQQLIISIHPQLKSLNVTVEFQDVYRGKNYRATYLLPFVQNIVVTVYVNNGYQSTLVSYITIPIVIAAPPKEHKGYDLYECQHEKDECHHVISTLEAYCPEAKGLKPIIQRQIIVGNATGKVNDNSNSNSNSNLSSNSSSNSNSNHSSSSNANISLHQNSSPHSNSSSNPNSSQMTIAPANDNNINATITVPKNNLKTNDPDAKANNVIDPKISNQTGVSVNYRLNYTANNISAVINVSPPNITSIVYLMSPAPPSSEGYTTFTNSSDPAFVAALQKVTSLNRQISNSTMTVQCQQTLSGMNFLMSIILPQSSIIAIVAVSINHSLNTGNATTNSTDTPKENNSTSNSTSANSTSKSTTNLPTSNSSLLNSTSNLISSNATTNSNSTDTHNGNQTNKSTPQMTSYLITYDVKPRYELLSLNK